MGSVVTTLERADARPLADLPPGQGLEYYLEDGSEVHGGDNLTDEIRHRLGVFAEQPPAEDRWRDPLVRAVVATEAWRRRRA